MGRKKTGRYITLVMVAISRNEEIETTTLDINMLHST